MINSKISQRKRGSFSFSMLFKIDIKVFVTIISFAFIGTSIYGNFETLFNYKITNDEIKWILLGIIFSFLSIIINAYAWKLLIKNIGCKSNKLDVVKLFLVTNIYKYLPGGVWHFVSRFKKLRLEFSTEKSIESILLEPLLMLVAGFFFIPFGSQSILFFILCWSSTLVFLPAFRQLLIKLLKEMKSSIFTRKDQLNEVNSVKKIQDISIKILFPYKPLFVEIIFVLFRFFGFLCCMSAFFTGSVISQGELISSFSLAWIIGLIVPAAPGGLGVFESVILFKLGSNLPEAPLLMVLLFYRLVSTISDLFAALIYPVKKVFKV
tara:strand:- start:529 stop:1494 length:966 start_codon:yes stop_codon:yes gene_type:complete